MAQTVNLVSENGMMRVVTTIQTDMEGAITLSILVPNVNVPIIEIQAIALEFAADALAQRAAALRRIPPDSHIPD